MTALNMLGLALRSKVIDYILKPVMLKDIERVLAECKEFLDDRSRSSISDENIELPGVYCEIYQAKNG